MWKGPLKGWLEVFFLDNVWSKAYSWDLEPIFKPTYAESKLFGQIDCQPGFSSVVEFGSLARARDLAVSISRGFSVGSGHGMSIPHFTRKAHIKVQGARCVSLRPIGVHQLIYTKCCVSRFQNRYCQDQRFLPLLHRCVMAVASPVVVLLVDLQLRQQSIPSSFEVPFFAAPTKETERARESTGMILDEQLDEFKIYLFQRDEHSAWVEMVLSWGQKSRP